ncbi:hypothetical protein [Rhizosaccharibacter radicis]|uniref:Lipoprotein n=1 Tax=Rhizosaccharibacter radicis TaxID=2782605 RepID=A0ABT1VXL7_9PROT|nr:hypothetical protein [Acetobacteraceae bacterium KSS12]
MTRSTAKRFLLLLFVLASGCAARGEGRISNLDPIPVHEGVNDLQRFAPDGRQALVVVGRQDGALGQPADGARHLVVTMLPRTVPDRGWDVVPVLDPEGRAASLDTRDRTVRFARGKLSGMPATFLFVARPADPGVLPGQADSMRISIYRLAVGEDGGRFLPVGERLTRERFCTGDAALARSVGLPLIWEPAGGGDRSGCGSGV